PAPRRAAGPWTAPPAAPPPPPPRHQPFSLASGGARAAASPRHWDGLRPHLDGLYLSFETDLRPERIHDAFPGETLVRLGELKARYDPDQVFGQNFPIPPGVAAAPRGGAPTEWARGTGRQ